MPCRTCILFAKLFASCRRPDNGVTVSSPTRFFDRSVRSVIAAVSIPLTTRQHASHVSLVAVNPFIHHSFDCLVSAYLLMTAETATRRNRHSDDLQRVDKSCIRCRTYFHHSYCITLVSEYHCCRYHKYHSLSPSSYVTACFTPNARR